MRVLERRFVQDFIRMANDGYEQGWHERNGGNLSYRLTDHEVDSVKDRLLDHGEWHPIGASVPGLAGEYFLVTGTGKYFKNVKQDPENNLGIIRIAEDGCTAQLLWGYADGGKFTSELPAHLMSHMARRKVDPENRVIVHSHPTNTLAMTFIHPLTDKDFTHTLWQMNTECIVVFPGGVGVLPWMVCGTNEIGEATAAKMKDYRLVVWALHGIYGAGKNLDEAFGLIETVEKTAQVYMLTSHLERINIITDDNLRALAAQFNLSYRTDFLE